MEVGIQGFEGLLELLERVATEEGVADDDVYTDGCAATLLLEAERHRLNRHLMTALTARDSDPARVRELGSSLEEISSLLQTLRRQLGRMRPASSRARGRFRSRDPRDAPAAALPEQQ